ncbi:MAG: HEAT repeat domain-containing protein [Bradymonadia bacterium]
MMNRTGAPLALAFALALPLACSASPKADTTPRGQVMSLLLARHQLPVQKQFEAASPEAPAILKQVVKDASVPDFQRYAAYEALGYWPDDEVFDLYLAAIAKEQAEGQRHRVMRYLAQSFAERSVTPLAAALRDPDPQIRITAATALADVPGAKGQAAINEALKWESNKVVREKLEALQKNGGVQIQ